MVHVKWLSKLQNVGVRQMSKVKHNDKTITVRLPKSLLEKIESKALEAKTSEIKMVRSILK